MLLSSIAYAIIVPSASAAQATVQEKGSSILSNVISVDTAKYTIKPQKYPQDSYLGVVSQENVRYTLNANESKIDMLLTFANGNLRMIHVLESQGKPYLTKSIIQEVQLENTTVHVVNTVETAKVFLSNYETYISKSLYNGLSAMLDDVDANQNLTKISGNVKLEVSVSNDLTVFKWMYSMGGVDAPSKLVALGYKNGFLKYFIDNWDLYKIGSTTVNLSEKEAIDIAIGQANSFSWNMSTEDNNAVKITNFKVTGAMIWKTVFASNLESEVPRSADPLVLYPVRHVWVSLDKFYPGNVYGIEVFLWADTKEVASINERFSTLDPPVDLAASVDDYAIQTSGEQSVNGVDYNFLLMSWVSFPLFAGVMLGFFPVWLLLNGKKNLPKRLCKIGGILFCVLVSSTIVFAPISMVSAEPTRGALIFGSRSDGAMTAGPNGWHWRKTADELTQQGATSDTIRDYFSDDGYDAENNQGYPGSLHDNVLAKIEDTADEHSLAAIVDFDHGVGNERYDEFHYMFEDDNGTFVGSPPMATPNAIENGVYDYEIREITADHIPSKYFFSFINTCMSANTTNPSTGVDWQGDGNGRARSMPYAFTGLCVTTQPTSAPPSGYMSRNGYTHPDGGDFAYLGFPFGSAALCQTINGGGPIYAVWLEDFFYHALSFDITINHALDHASLDNYDALFGQIDLATGFVARWPMDKDGDGTFIDDLGAGSKLAVYGNGNIQLYQYFSSDVYDIYTSGTAYVLNEEGALGGSNDGQYATLDAVGQGSQAEIMMEMSRDTAYGDIILYGDTNGYNSRVKVWICSDYQNWLVVFDDFIDENSPCWINICSYPSEFVLLSIAVYNGASTVSHLDIDSVLVIPSARSEYYWAYESDEYEYLDGVVSNAECIEGSYFDGDFAQIYCPNQEDRADVIATLNREVVGEGRLYIKGCSYEGYDSDMYVYVSSYIDSGWELVDMYTITETSPYWIDFFTVSRDFRYVRIVGYDSGNSVGLLLDCICVTSYGT